MINLLSFFILLRLKKSIRYIDDPYYVLEFLDLVSKHNM